MSGLPPIRRLVKALFGPRLAFTLNTALYHVRTHGPAHAIRWNAMLAAAFVRDRRARRRYRMLDESAVRASRRSGTVFVFGSGASLNDLSQAEWGHFAEHDTFGFNAFYYQRWIPVGFHVLRGGVYGALRWQPHAEHVSERVRDNPLFEQTIFLMQDDYLGHFPNQLVGFGYLPPGARLFRYRTVRGWGPPTRSFRDGVRHVVGTLDDSVNAAFLLGWKEIVLVGVDLYDSRYFFLPPDRTVAVDSRTGSVGAGERNTLRGNRFDDPHNTAASGVVQLMDEWARVLESEGVRLSVYNPRSLLADRLPIYDRAERRAERVSL